MDKKIKEVLNNVVFKLSLKDLERRTDGVKTIEICNLLNVSPLGPKNRNLIFIHLNPDLSIGLFT